MERLGPRTAALGDTVDLQEEAHGRPPPSGHGRHVFLVWTVPRHTSATLRPLLAFTSTHTGELPKLAPRSPKTVRSVRLFSSYISCLGYFAAVMPTWPTHCPVRELRGLPA